MKTMHLRYSLMSAFDSNENRHAQLVMRELGIKYQHATPQSMVDQWWFWNCTNVPKELPAYIDELKVNPMDVIGYGLSPEQAISIHDAAQDGVMS